LCRWQLGERFLLTLAEFRVRKSASPCSLGTRPGQITSRCNLTENAGKPAQLIAPKLASSISAHARPLDHDLCIRLLKFFHDAHP